MRLALAQILYNPAYYEPPIDFLSEPTDGTAIVPELGLLRQVDEVAGLLLELKGDIIAHTLTKIVSIVQWAAEQKVDLLAFPEYAIPAQLLPVLKDLALKNAITIVGGSHRVAAGNESRTTYQELSVDGDSRVGSAICPIFLPTGEVHIVSKAAKSKWEPSLRTGSPAEAVINIPCRDGTFRAGVLLCIDAISPHNLGQLWADKSQRPNIVICPSLSPTTDVFASVAELVSLNEAAFAYVNSAGFGGTGFYLPDVWKPHIETSAGTFAPLPAGVEGVIRIDMRADKLVIKHRTALFEPFARRPVSIPIRYQNEAKSIQQFTTLKQYVKEGLAAGEVSTSAEYLDLYLAEPEAGVPELAVRNLLQLRNAVLPLYSGDLSLVDEAFEVLDIDKSCEPTARVWANHVRRALDTLLSLISNSNQLPESIWNSVKLLKKLQLRLPIASSVSADVAVSALPPSDVGFKGASNLIEAFQDRGSDFDRFRDFTQNAESRVLMVTGPRGIGKTDFLNAVFAKNLTDWDVIRVPVVRATSAARLVADIGFRLGIVLDIDALAAATSHVFQEKVKKIVAAAYSHPKRALVIDDLADLIETATGRDFRHLDVLFQQARSPGAFTGGRIVFVTSAWLKSEWLNAKGVHRLQIRELQDIYIRRIIEYQLRFRGEVPGEAPPHIPQQLLDVLRGHPLSARILVDAGHAADLAGAAEVLERITEQIAAELLKSVRLSREEEDAISRIAVFRLPIRSDVITEGFNVNNDILIRLARSAVLDYDGSLFKMHEAVRRFFYARIPLSTRKLMHLGALQYYERQRTEEERLGSRNPTTAAELVFHAVMSGDVRIASKLKMIVVDELKPTARRIYREEHDYERALQIYKELAEIVPDDPEVVAYLGRCQARVGNWNESKVCFQRALDLANRRGEGWWVLRDWGHILARFGFYDEAQQRFEQSEKKRGTPEPSICAALAYMYWRSGDIQEARDLFEEALEINPNHQYALTYYPKLLREVGKYAMAASLLDRLDSLQQFAVGEHEMDFEAEDL